MMKRTMLVLFFAMVVTCLAAPRAHAQLWGGDPLNNQVCPADMSGSQCLAAGYGGTGSSGGSGTTICRGTMGNPASYCFSPTYDANGNLSNKCARALVSSGYCRCTSGNMSGSCTMFAR
jgi:hypothetical protein